MSKRTYNKFREELTSLFYDYSYDDCVFSEKGYQLLKAALKHREINEKEYLSLVDMYERMYASMGFLED